MTPASARLLYVEDDLGLARLVEKRLGRLGYRVTLAPDGAAGLAKARQGGFDAVLVDHQMPGMTGLQVIEALRSDPEPPPTIMITGAGDERVAVEAMRLGASDYIIKDAEAGYLTLIPLVIERALARDRLAGEKRQADLALAASERKYRLLVENANEGIIVVQEGFLKFFNPKALEITGHAATELAEIPVGDLLHPEDRDRAAAGFYPPNGVEAPGVRECRIIDGNGRVRWVEINGVAIEWEGRPAELNFVTDITERKALESELRKSEKLRAIGNIAGGIAHDFNNLLMVILGYLNMVRDEAVLEPRALEMLHKAETASLQARGLTQKFITFASGGHPVRRRRTLGRFVVEVVTRRLSGTLVKPAFSVDPDLWAVEADLSQMGQVVDNLVANAVEAMPEGGEIDVAVENVRGGAGGRVRHRAVGAGRHVRIAIRDRGRGIPESDIDKVFEPYYSTKERGPQRGLGFGLATAFYVVEKHGGRLFIDSPPGEGTTVSIYLPAASEAPADTAATVDPGPGPREEGRERRVLLMDDEEMVRDVAGRMLRKLGFRVEAVADGGEAVARCCRAREMGTPFDLVILDLTVREGMGGREAMAEIRRLVPETVGIVSSGYSDDPVMTDPRRYGFRAALPKPYQTGEIQAAVGEILGPEPETDPGGIVG